MNKHRITGVLFILLMFTSLFCYANEVEMIKRNYVKLLLSEGQQNLVEKLELLPQETKLSDQMAVELMDRYPIQKENVTNLLSTLQKNGAWSDIDYADKSRSGWAPMNHMLRILLLTKAYRTPNSGYYSSDELEDAIHASLKYWFDTDLKCLNWWYNQIGIPKTLGGALILFEDRLTPAEMQGGLRVMSQAKFGMTGQNKVWLAGIVLVRSLLTEDEETIRTARNIILSEIKVSDDEGIKFDASYHQHGPQQQFGNYGLAYIGSMSFWSQMFAETSLELDQKQLDILSQLINEGFRRIQWNGYFDVNGLGRQLFKQAQRHKAFSSAFSSMMLSEVDENNRAKYDAFIDENFFHTNQTKTLNGLYHFWLSDMTIQRCSYWMASLKMPSKRTIASETVNEDNKKGFYLGDGALYTYVDGDEYDNIYPSWDWRRIPGVTNYSALAKTDVPKPVPSGFQNKKDFVGNVSDGESGLTVMDYEREGLSMRKAWLFTEGYVLCLGAGISSDSGRAVTTSIEQQLKKDDLFRLDGDRWTKIEKNNFVAQNTIRFHHHKKGYIILGSATGTASAENQSGDWHDVMGSYPKGTIADNAIVSLWLDHGQSPENASYQYLIIPAASKEEVRDFDTNNIQPLHNTKDMQVISLTKEKMSFIAFYTPSEVRISENIHLKSSKPGLFMVKEAGAGLCVMASDPTQQLSSAEIELNGVNKVISFPQGNMRGTSVEIQF